MDKFESEQKSKAYCSMRGGVKGCHGKSEYPLGQPGNLGPCCHGGSRGPRGKVKTLEEKERSREYKKKRREEESFSKRLLPIQRTDYNYCKVCGGPLRDPSIACVFCGSVLHLELNY